MSNRKWVGEDTRIPRVVPGKAAIYVVRFGTVGGFASEGKPGIPPLPEPVSRAASQDDRNEKGKSTEVEVDRETRQSLVSLAIRIPPINLHLSRRA